MKMGQKYYTCKKWQETPGFYPLLMICGEDDGQNSYLMGGGKRKVKTPLRMKESNFAYNYQLYEISEYEAAFLI